MQLHVLKDLRDRGLLAAGPQSGVPDVVFSPKAMLIDDERSAIYNIVRHAFEGLGEIVDLGCLAGGSTVCLAQGYVDSGLDCGARVNTYDLFHPSAYIKEYLGLTNELSVLPVFRDNTKIYGDLVNVKVGDVGTHGWCGRPIEVLFIDCAKSWKTGDEIKRHFYRSLIPGRSIIIHQDFLFNLTPWLFIQMEFLADFFELVHYHECNSAYFFCKRPIPDEYIDNDLAGLWYSDKIALLDQAQERYRGTLIEPWLTRAVASFHNSPDPLFQPQAVEVPVATPPALLELANTTSAEHSSSTSRQPSSRTGWRKLLSATRA